MGAPRSFQVAADGSRVTFLRSPSGDDPDTELWAFDPPDGPERLIASPPELTSSTGGETLEERARRERARETAEGIVSYATDRHATVAAFALSGRLFVVDLAGGRVTELDVPTPVFDPRPSPTGDHIAFVHDRGLHTVRLADRALQKLAGETSPTVTWGMAEFVAAEEMERHRGYWWSPAGDRLLVARVDEAPVAELFIAAPAEPASAPRPVRYPLAGSANAEVQLHLIALDQAAPAPVSWDTETHPYLAAGHWESHGPLIAVQSRDQRHVLILAVDPDTGVTTQVAEQRDPDWVDLIPGVPRRLKDGRLVTVAASGDALALAIDGAAITPNGLEVRAVLSVGDEHVLFAASSEPTETHVFQATADGALHQLTRSAGVHTAVSAAGRHVIGTRDLRSEGTRWSLGNHEFASHAERPSITPSPALLDLGSRNLKAALLLPDGHVPGTRLPVLLDPYGGPHFQRVTASRHAWLESQWLADQGFVVLVADGRGTPGRGLQWARAVAGDLAGPVLDDQIDALHAAAECNPDLDLDRVAIRGWSFGGYLAALAVLRRPDVFHAAVAGAPVTDWRLYDTHYTERYLGTAPDGRDRDAYDRSSLLADAAALSRPLLIIHGLADDNVVVAHTLRFSQRLTEAGRLHAILPLSGITHMTPQEAVAENLLNIQVDFLRRALIPAGEPRCQPA